MADAFSANFGSPNTSAFWEEVGEVLPTVPRFWEVALDGFYVNSSLASQNEAGLSALLDTVSDAFRISAKVD